MKQIQIIIIVLVLLVLACGIEPVTTPQVWTPEPTSTIVPTWTPRPPALARVYMVTDSLNLRECPRDDDVTCPAIVQMPAGTLVAVTYWRDGQLWAAVEIISIPEQYSALTAFVGRRGWCSVEWLEQR